MPRIRKFHTLPAKQVQYLKDWGDTLINTRSYEGFQLGQLCRPVFYPRIKGKIAAFVYHDGEVGVILDTGLKGWGYLKEGFGLYRVDNIKALEEE